MESNTGVQNLKCKFQIGNATIEIEGVDPHDEMIRGKIAELMDTFIESLSEVDILVTNDELVENVATGPSDKESGVSGDTNKPAKKDNRGGRRIPWVAEAIEDLAKTGKIINVTPEDVIKMIKDKTASNPDRPAVIGALNRRLGKDMIRTADPPGSDTYRYSYQPPKEVPKTP